MRETIGAVILRLDWELNLGIPESLLAVGTRVMLYDETTECEAILRHGKYGDRWVADTLRETIRDLPEDQWDRLKKK